MLDAKTGAPLAGVMVEVQRSGHSARTDEQGGFVLPGVPAGRQALFVSTIGYALARPVVDVRAGADADVTVPLAEGTGAYTERVTVTGNASPVPSRQLRCSRRSAARVSRACAPCSSTIRCAPCRRCRASPPTTTSAATSRYAVLGFGQVGLSIDGVATPWLLHNFEETEDSGSLAILNSDILDHVTLSSGSYPQRYGDRTGAWLDSTIREGSRAATEIRGAVSGTNASLLAEGPIGAAADGAWLVSFRRSYIDWLLRRVVPDFGSTVFGFTDLEAKVVYDLTPRQQLQVTAIGGLARLDDESDPDPGSIAHAADDLALGTLALRSTLGSSTIVTQRASVVTQRFQNVNPYSVENGRGSVRDLSYRADLTWTPRGDTLVDAGAQFQQQQASRTIHQYRFAPDRVTPLLRRSDTFDASARVASAFAHVVFGAGRRFSIAPGARVAHSTLVNETVLSPWVQANWSLTGSLSLRAGAGLYHQFPDFAQVYGPHAGVNLRSERARHLDVARRAPGDADDALAGVGLSPRRRPIPAPCGERVPPRERRGRLAAGRRPVGQRAQRPVERRGAAVAAEQPAGAVRLGLVCARPHDVSRRSDWRALRRRLRSAAHRERVGAVPHLEPHQHQRQAAHRIELSMAGYWEQRDSRASLIGEQRNEVRLPTYARLDVRANRVFNYTKRRLTLFVEVMNVLNRDNVRRTSPALLLSTRTARRAAIRRAGHQLPAESLPADAVRRSAVRVLITGDQEAGV